MYRKQLAKSTKFARQIPDQLQQTIGADLILGLITAQEAARLSKLAGFCITRHRWVRWRFEKLVDRIIEEALELRERAKKLEKEVTRLSDTERKRVVASRWMRKAGRPEEKTARFSLSGGLGDGSTNDIIPTVVKKSRRWYKPIPKNVVDSIGPLLRDKTITIRAAIRLTSQRFGIWTSDYLWRRWLEEGLEDDAPGLGLGEPEVCNTSVPGSDKTDESQPQ